MPGLGVRPQLCRLQHSASAPGLDLGLTALPREHRQQRPGWILDLMPSPLLLQPPTGTDTMVKSGVSTSINTKHQCITAMKEYESKSLEVSRERSNTLLLSGCSLVRSAELLATGISIFCAH